jgi:hypothetical protein
MRTVVAEQKDGLSWTDNALRIATVQIMLAAGQNKSAVGGVSKVMIEDVLGVNEITVDSILKDLLDKGYIEQFERAGQGAAGESLQETFMITGKGSDYLAERFSKS